MLQRMMDARDELLGELWAQRARRTCRSPTPEEAVILASIVEKETAHAGRAPADRGRVRQPPEEGHAAGEPIRPSIYGLTGGEPLGHGLRESELQSQTPYNTYLIAGLPPTPIGNPGRASLAAVLDPPSTDELYFVADGTGGHAFSSTSDEHQQNVARWRAIEATRRPRHGRRAAAPPESRGADAWRFPA